MKVLVIGGTQFLGRLTVEALLDAKHEVIVVNRGRTANPFQGRSNLRCVKADRMQDRAGFRSAVAAQGDCDVVIDFIGFQAVYVEDALEALTLPGSREAGNVRFATKHYVFISSDSVYWAQKVPITSRLAESDAQDFTPEEFENHQENCKKTILGEYQLRYGGNKLACEHVLEEAWRADGFPFTVLRLPDVYGPYDNLGGFWELLVAIEGAIPIHSGMHEARTRNQANQDSVGGARCRRFSWAFAEDVRDAILACLAKGADLHGVSMNVGHEEAVSLRETASMIAEAMDRRPEAVRYDDRHESALPSTDYGSLDVAKALRLLRPWRPTPMRTAVQKSVKWYLSSKEHRRYHRHVHRETRFYDETASRFFRCQTQEVPTCWVGSPDKAALVRDGPVALKNSLPEFTGQAVLNFMQRLMDQAGEMQVSSELQRETKVERQTWPLRHFAGHLLPQSQHTAAYSLETSEVLQKTDVISSLIGPLADICDDDCGQPPERILHLGGAGARTTLRRTPSASGPGGFWDCTLLGRRVWRFFPPQTALDTLCVASPNSDESPVDCFSCGPDVKMVPMQYTHFAPATCWEYEQTMGDAVVVPNGWWYQVYDDDRTLSISSRYGSVLTTSQAQDRIDDDVEVIEYDIVD